LEEFDRRAGNLDESDDQRGSQSSPAREDRLQHAARRQRRCGSTMVAVILSSSSQLRLFQWAPKAKGGMSVMKHNFNGAGDAMSDAHQDCLLSARPR